MKKAKLKRLFVMSWLKQQQIARDIDTTLDVASEGGKEITVSAVWGTCDHAPSPLYPLVVVQQKKNAWSQVTVRCFCDRYRNFDNKDVPERDSLSWTKPCLVYVPKTVKEIKTKAFCDLAGIPFLFRNFPRNSTFTTHFRRSVKYEWISSKSSLRMTTDKWL